MQNLVAKLTGSIEKLDSDSNIVLESDVDFINENLSVLSKITSDDIYVRGCWLAGDAINTKLGRFRTEDLGKLLELTNGAPLMEMHKSGGFFGLAQAELPLARFFGGKIKSKEIDHLDGSRGPANFIVPKFYWMKNSSGAEDLKLNIDGGIFNEASIGFSYKEPLCSVCSENIQNCKHVPGEEYKSGLSFYWYDQPQSVVEGSIVHRGADLNTQFESNILSETVIDKKIIRVKYKGIITKLGYVNG